MCRSHLQRRSLGAIAACLAVALSGCTDKASGGGGGSGGAGTSSGGAIGGSATAGRTGGGLTTSGGATKGGTTGSSGFTAAGGKSSGGTSSATGGTSTGTAGSSSAALAGANHGGSLTVTGGTAGGIAGAGGAGGIAGAGGAGGIAGAGGAGGAGGANGGATGGGGANGTAGTPSTCPPATPLTGGSRYCSNTTGTVGGGYSYELWGEGAGSGCMTVYGKDATFGATWNDVEDLLARVGLQFDRTKTHSQIGTLSAEFAETKTGSNGLVYIGIYGWTVSPLREYYILDDWGEIKPAGTASDGTPRTFVGDITVDGETYDVWKKTRMNKPAITGPSETFDQYFSIRRTARRCGRISISEHFSKWEELGLPLGNLTEAKILVEAQASTGTLEFTTAKVVVE